MASLTAVDAVALHNRPRFHVSPKAGWLNDPNGPIFLPPCPRAGPVTGKYHVFFQSNPKDATWDWCIQWAHATSDDGVRWTELPPAIQPGRASGDLDADGCWSGTCVMQGDTPVLLFTGVRKDDERLRQGAFHDLLTIQQVQLAAVPKDLSDPRLTEWRKVPGFAVAPPPELRPEMQGFRDPFVVQTIETMNRPEKHIIVGSGLRGRGGTILVYRATDVTQPWDFAGVLCTEGTDTGPIWECPGLISVPVEHVAGHTPSGYATLGPQHAGPPGRADGASFGHVPPSPGAPATVDLLSVGHFPPDTCLTHCWLGHYDPDSCRFDLANARGPACLDHGDACYAPTFFRDANGRVVAYAWVMEKRDTQGLGYAGCLSVPRVLSQAGPGGPLAQAPLPELSKLRMGDGWQRDNLTLRPAECVALDGVNGRHVEVELLVRPGSAPAPGSDGDPSHDVLALVVPAAPPHTNGYLLSADADAAQGAIVAISLDTHETLVAVGDGPPDPQWLRRSEAKARRAACKPGPDGAMHVRVFLDGSCLEVFSGATGQVLTRRVYRSWGAAGADAGQGPAPRLSVHNWAWGDVTLVRARVWDMEGAFPDR